MSSATKLLPLILSLPLFLSSSSAQQTPKRPLETRTIVANVLDINGNAVRDLAKENFQLSLNGKPSMVLDARYSLLPRRIVVLLDISGSMTGEKPYGKWRIANEAVQDLLEQTPEDVSIAMLTFSGKVRDVFDFSKSRIGIFHWLKDGPGRRPKLKYRATTALFDAILESLKLLQPVQPGDAIYAITDGADDASQASEGRVKTGLLKSGVRLFALLLAEPLSTSEEQAARSSFLSIVADSGGFAFGAFGHPMAGGVPWESNYLYGEDNIGKLRLFTRQLNIQVSEFWTLELAVPVSTKESKVKLDVISDAGKLRRDVSVTYSRKLIGDR